MATISRTALLVGALAVGVAGCHRDDESNSRGQAEPPPGTEPVSTEWAGLPRFIDGRASCLGPAKPIETSPNTRAAEAPSWRLQALSDVGQLRDQLLGHEESLERRVLELEQRLEDDRRRHQAEIEQLLRSTRRGVFVSNDEPMSIASPQRLLWALDHEEALPHGVVRPHELLNYFSFDAAAPEAGQDLAVTAEMAPHPARPHELTFAFVVRSRPVLSHNRPALNLAYALDRSGSMASEGRLTAAKRALLRSLSQLRPGDVIHVTLFDSTTCNLARNFVVGRDSMARLRSLVSDVETQGASTLLAGLERAYDTVNQAYRPNRENRVLLLTDAIGADLADEALLRLVGHQHDRRHIRLSAAGIGAHANDSMIDRLTERGHGASVLFAEPEETDVMFGPRFDSLVYAVATDTRFQLMLPPGLSVNAFYGEEASPNRSEVEGVDFFAQSQQLHLANLIYSGAPLTTAAEVGLNVTYDDPRTGQPREQAFRWTVAELAESLVNLPKARMVATFGYQLRRLLDEYGDPVAQRDWPSWKLAALDVTPDHEPGQGDSPQMLGTVQRECDETARLLSELAARVPGDPEAERLEASWFRFCERYRTIRRPEPVALGDSSEPGPNPEAERNEFLPGHPFLP